jgi:hypothetical protein
VIFLIFDEEERHSSEGRLIRDGQLLTLVSRAPDQAESEQATPFYVIPGNMDPFLGMIYKYMMQLKRLAQT